MSGIGRGAVGRTVVGRGGAADFSVLPPFESLLADPDLRRYHIVVLDPFDTDVADISHYEFLDGGWLGDKIIPVRVHEALDLRAGVFIDPDTGSFGGSPGIGEIVLLPQQEDDGVVPLDALTSLRWDGRRIEVRLGGDGFSYAQFVPVFIGEGVDAMWTDKGARIVVADPTLVLGRPAQANLYAGTGGLEGTINLLGKPKPLLYGRALNFQPVLVDPQSDVYQIHDGPIDAVEALFDKGLELIQDAPVADVYATTPANGHFHADLSLGVLRLGAPPGGQLTCIARGDKTGGTYVVRANKIVERFIETHVPGLSIDQVAAGELDLDTQILPDGGEAAIYVPDAASVSDVIDPLLASINAFRTLTRLGDLFMGKLKFETPVKTLVETNVISISRVRTPTPHWRRQIGYAPNYLVQSDADLGIYQAETPVYDFEALGRWTNAADDVDVPTIPVGGPSTNSVRIDVGVGADGNHNAAWTPYEDAPGIISNEADTVIGGTLNADSHLLEAGRAAVPAVYEPLTVPAPIGAPGTAGTLLVDVYVTGASNLNRCIFEIGLASRIPVVGERGIAWQFLGDTIPANTWVTLALDPANPDTTDAAWDGVNLTHFIKTMVVEDRGGTREYSFHTDNWRYVDAPPVFAYDDNPIANPPWPAGADLSAFDDFSIWTKGDETLAGIKVWVTSDATPLATFPPTNRAEMTIGAITDAWVKSVGEVELLGTPVTTAITAIGVTVDWSSAGAPGDQWQLVDGTAAVYRVWTTELFPPGTERFWFDWMQAFTGAGVDPTHRGFVREAYRVLTKEDASILTRRPRAQESLLFSLLDSVDDAWAITNEQFDLLSVDRDRYDLVTRGVQFALKPGNTVRLTYPRFGLDTGREFIIIGLGENTSKRQTTLRLWG